jgi:hypothetical protein
MVILSINISKENPGRGMLLYVKDSLKYSPYNFKDTQFEEHLFCEVVTGHNEKILIGSLYRSPSGTDSNFEQLYKIFKESRGRGSDNPSVIDLVFTSEEGVLENLNINPPLGKSDHSVIEMECNLRSFSDNKKKTRYKYNKGDYSKLAELLDVNWDEEFSDRINDVEGQWCKCKNIVEKSIEQTIPKKIVSQTGKRKQDPKHTIPLNRKALPKIKQKESLWTRYLNTRDDEAYKEYCKVRNQVRTLTRKITKQFEKQIAQEVKANPKKFWKYARSKTKTKSNIPDLFKDDNKTEFTNSDKEKATVLVDFFTSVFIIEGDGKMPDIEKIDVPPLETMIIIKKS